MEESGKAPESDCTGDVTGELRALLAILDDDCGDDFSPMNRIKEELVEEVMQELWKEISCCYGGMNSPLSPSSFPVTSSSVGGDNKTCGPSFSDSSWTVMADIEMDGTVNASGGGVSCFMEHRRGKKGSPGVAGDGSWVVDEDGGCPNVGGGETVGKKMDGSDGGVVDHDGMSCVISGGPQEFEDWI